MLDGNVLAIVETDICLPAEVMAFREKAREYATHAKAQNTRRAYASDWSDFAAWCETRQAASLPADPATVLAYLIDSSERVKISTLQRRLVAIREAHKYAGHELNTSGVGFRDAWRGLRRVKGLPANKKAPVMTVDLRRALAALPGDTLAGVRDRALLLVGFGAALRRSELAGLAVTPQDGACHICETADGLVVTLGHSKTDQTSEGQTIGVPYGSNPETCPVRAYKGWIEASGIQQGAAFRAIDRHGNVAVGAISDKAVALIVKRSIEAAALAEGATAAEAKQKSARFSGHSLRSGLATSAAANDAPGHSIQRHLRHKKFETTAGYIQTGQLFKQNAAGMAGL
jgi:site-specific recombinase XerD